MVSPPRYWRRLQAKRALRSAVITSAESFGVSIAKRFLPSVAVDAYRFRGMSRKQVPVSIQFQELGLLLADGRSVLDGVSGSFLPGRMVAIMGPSGAGKTTFMNVLCGKATYGEMTGQVTFNDGQLDLPTMKQGMGFVPQDDIVHEQLTVRENIFFSAKLRNPYDAPDALLEEVVEDVLNVMQMTHIQGSVVGGVEERGISGGQRKRVNIGLELAARPTVLYLDEPTSGLDSTSSLQVINSLSKMARLDMTIAMVIHQPRYPLFSLFDDVLLLGPGGRTVYLGPSQGAKGYFTSLGFEMPDSENPADWLMDVLSGVVPNDQLSDFRPAMLFDIWKSKKDSINRDQVRRSLTALEDSAVLVNAIEEEWAKIDKDSSGSMDAKELSLLLQTCGEKQPHPEAVSEMLRQISGGKDFATKQDMVTFVHRLRTSDPTSAGGGGGTGMAAPAAVEETQRLLTRQPGEAPTEGRPLPRFTLPRPGFCQQCGIVLQRRFAMFMRETWRRMVDLGLVFLCSSGIGVMHRGGNGANSLDLPGNLHMFFIGLALLSAVSSLKVFGENRPMFWRESANGISVGAFFTARALGNVFDVLLLGSTYVLIYFILTRPPVPYMDYFIPGLLVAFAAASWGYLISAVIQPHNATTATVMFVLVGCGILGNPYRTTDLMDGGAKEILLSLSLNRWALPMCLSATIESAQSESLCIDVNVLLAHQVYHNEMSHGKYTLWNQGVLALSCTTLVVTLLAFLGLKFTNRSKQV
ncbi:ABC transporter G family member 24 (ABC transporter ABCG.24) (AtABCG24) (Probable white-brown complex homolog protein 25) (AtWBC25) [Durusdinium trenchii]|uniref:ABC transporter G family member 24 (ABC transporter ABCG.24) (AtABCG24) (Probable white-brown complex homolog protein 25) (AtWBC25) n=1 Tax=Durusdinium trenchii TaxID=1381693 RepID=A0ABP0I699_9DINO